MGWGPGSSGPPSTNQVATVTGGQAHARMTPRPDAKPPANGRRRRRIPALRVSRDGLSTFAFLLPALLIFGVFSWFPIIRSLVMSVQETNLVSTPTFVGADNFARVLADPLFGKAVLNTAYFALLALIFGFPIPLVLAVIMSEVRRFKGLYSALAYLPVVSPPVVSVLLWRFFFDARPAGVFNSILGWFGLGPLPWLQDAGSAMPSIVFEATWAAAGGTVIIYLAALLSVPPELYDAAEVDGASIWRKIRHVTLPHLRGVLLITLILQLIATAQLFTEPFLFTGGGPANSTTTVLLLIYHYAFQNSLGGDYGMAAALSVMLAAFLGLFTAGYFWLTRSWSTSS
jgi:multiple sugar transport system permease protein